MKGKRFTPAVVCVLLLCVSGLFAATLQVGPGKTYTTITDAINVAAPGDTIIVDAGNYAEAINLSAGSKAGLKIYGPNRDIDPYANTRGAEAVIKPAAGNPMVHLGTGATNVGVEFNGFTIDGENQVKSAVQSGNGDIFAYNKITNVSGAALQGGGPDMLVTHNWVNNIVNVTAGSGNSGIFPSASGGAAGQPMVISYNTITNINYAGIQIGGSYSYLDIIGNTIQNTGRHGMNIGPGCSFVRVIGNRISNVNYQDNRTDEDTGGIRIYGGIPFGSSDIEIAYNTVENAKNGIHFRGNICMTIGGCPAATYGACTYPAVAYGEYQFPTTIPENMSVHDNNFINCLSWGYHAPRPIQPGECGYVDPPIVLDGQNNYVDGNGQGEAATTITENNNPAPTFIIADSDGDGLKDWEEIYIYGTEPDDADQDNDGVIDGVQLKLGGDPKNSIPAPGPVPGAGDGDNDGFYDWYEALVGTSWTDKNDFPKLGDINNNKVIDNGDAAIVYNFVLGRIEGFGFDPARMDANQDGVVNNLDANILFNKFLGIAGYGILPYRP